MSHEIQRHVVVCVDDEPGILDALKRLLRNEPYEILTTESPARALKWVATRDVSLVISDQRMPDMQGTDLLEEVHRRSPTTARVILTAFPGTAATPGLRQRIECMISKPWDGAMLRRVVHQLVRDRELEEKQEEALEAG